MLLHWSHPPPNCNFEGQGSILFNIFWMVQQIHLQGPTGFSIIVIPVESTKIENCLDCGVYVCNYELTYNRFFKGWKRKTHTSLGVVDKDIYVF